MPIRNEKGMKPSRGIADAMASDEQMVHERARVKPKPKAKRDALLGGQTYRVRRDHWAGHAKAEGKTVIGLMEEFFRARYGLPDNDPENTTDGD